MSKQCTGFLRVFKLRSREAGGELISSEYIISTILVLVCSIHIYQIAKFEDDQSFSRTFTGADVFTLLLYVHVSGYTFQGLDSGSHVHPTHLLSRGLASFLLAMSGNCLQDPL